MFRFILPLIFCALSAFGQTPQAWHSMLSRLAVPTSGGLTAPSFVRSATNSWVAGSQTKTLSAFDCSGGTYLVVGFCLYGSGTGNQATQVLANAVAMTELVRTNWYSSAGEVSLWGLPNPTTGDIVASFYTSIGHGVMGAVLLNNGSSVGSVAAAYLASTTLYGMTNTVSSTVTTDTVIDGLGFYVNTSAASGDYQTTRLLARNVGAGLGMSMQTGLAGSTTMYWTNTAADRLAQVVAVIHGK